MNYKKAIACLCACCICGCMTPYTSHPTAGFAAESEDNDTSNDINFTEIGQYTVISFPNTTETPSWRSDNTAVATVDSTGKITAVGAGTANVYAVFSTQIITFNIIVTLPGEITNIEVGNIALSNDQPSAQISLSGADLTGAEWSTSDATIATVDDKGVVTAVGSGTCKITASVGDKNYIATVISTYTTSVKPDPDPVEDVILGKIELTTENSSANIILSNVPDGATITWSSTDISVATVDSNGTVKAVGMGECRIIALINGVKYITEISSTYTPQTVVTEKVLGDMTLSNDQKTGKINLANVPDGATITWSTSDASVATVDDTGIVTAVGSGTCKIIAEIEGINYIMNITSTYDPALEPAIKSEAAEMTLGSTMQLSIVNSTDTPEWISSNINVVTVDENGLVTAVGEGTTEVLAQLDGKVCTVTITVVKAPGLLYGDADCNGVVELNDAVLVMCNIVDAEANPITGEGLIYADVYQSGDGLSNMDALSIQKYLAQLIPELPESYM